jgi:tetratricopeptide (TPR) repeat protein
LSLLAEAYSGAGDVKGNPYRPNLGDLTHGLELHRKSLSTLLKIKSPDQKARAEILEEHRTIAGLLTSSGDLNEAEQHARVAVKMATELVKTGPSTRATKALGNAREVLARILLTREQWDEALVVYKEITVADQAMVTADPKDMQALAYLATDYAQIGHILNNQKKFPEALEYYSKALAIDQKLLALDQTNDVASYGVSIDYLSIADALSQSGDLSGALKNQQEAVKIQKQLVEENKNDLQAALNLAYAQDQLSQTFASLGNHQRAVTGFSSGIEAGEKALKNDSQNQRARRQLALRYLGLGDSNLALSQWQNARNAYQRSLELLNELNKNRILPPQYAEKLTDIPKKIAACDEALTGK